jgi:hypothetical protein
VSSTGADLVRVLVADAEIGCPHLLPGRDAWRTTAKILMHGHLCCIAPACIVALEVYLIEHGLLRARPAECGICGSTERVLALSVTSEADALTAYLPVCDDCVEALVDAETAS